MAEGKIVLSSKCKFISYFSKFYTVLPLIPGLPSQCGYKETKMKQTPTKILTATKPRKQQTQRKDQPCCWSPQASEIAPCSGEVFSSQDLFTLLEQPKLRRVIKRRQWCAQEPTKTLAATPAL